MRQIEREHMKRLAQMPCCLCGTHGVELHHIREGQGMSQRASHFLTIPLCPDCHRGANGIHGDRAMLKVLKTDELDLLAKTIEELYA